MTEAEAHDRAEPPKVPAPPTPWRRRALRSVLWGLSGLLGLLLLAAVAAGLWGWRTLTGSLPIAGGTVALSGLSAPVILARDALGVPTVSGHTRLDVARATGFLHAQERFFQMDLQRRQAAGELAELVGRAALPLDRRSRIHRLRARAQRVLAAMPTDQRALLDAYTGGVNAGLAALRTRPFEYLLLGSPPAPWRSEDSVLVVLSMFMELQDERGDEDRRRGLMHDRLPPPLAEFLLSPGSDWDTPLEGPQLPPPPIPGPEVMDLRAPVQKAAQARPPVGQSAPSGTPEIRRPASGSWAPPNPVPEPELAPGSNGLAVAGAHTASGAALVASDMHLGLAVPNIWFRAVLSWGDGPPQRRARLVGVTLPGVPALVAGSNGHVAWAFTNAEIDASDLVIIDPDPVDPSRYLTSTGPRHYETHVEAIGIKGEAVDRFEVRESLWGPVVGRGPDGRARALRWVAHDVEGVNLGLMHMEGALTLVEALEVAQRSGIPAQNCVIADTTGAVGWTIAGRIPRRVGFDGRLPASWADGSRGWRGWLAPADYPRIVDPPSGRIVTANNRLVGGDALRILGEQAYDQGARARQIGDALLAIQSATPQEMLRVQLDDRALFLARWRRLALDLLTPASSGAAPRRREFRDLLEHTWTGRASTDSVAYRLVKAFRAQAAELAFAPLLEPLREVDSHPPSTPGRSMEGALWQLVTRRPAHLLDPHYASWDALLLDAIDRTAAELTEGGRPLDGRTWGEANTLAMRHPVSLTLPWLGPLLDMEARALPGDTHMPRVQGPGFGASERLVVSPGHESEGLFHMPGGQSGHPLSPAYRAGHDAWVEGRATPLLPGPAVSTLHLVPANP